MEVGVQHRFVEEVEDVLPDPFLVSFEVPRNFRGEVLVKWI